MASCEVKVGGNFSATRVKVGKNCNNYISFFFIFGKILFLISNFKGSELILNFSTQKTH